MSTPSSDDVTLCLAQMQAGDTMARDKLFEHIYSDLRALAQRLFANQQKNQTLQPTALVHEAYLRLVGNTKQTYNDRRHFLSVAALAMRQLITDQAKARLARKRGGGQQRVMLEQAEAEQADEASGLDLLVLDEALTELAELDARQCRIVELRFLAGLSVDETAETLGVSARTVALDWKMAKSFLALRLGNLDVS
ncbi:MAG: DNA-directed RNA polymerase sigma-70 factor [Planctomycetota bacterium]|nr:MAG: DNA-directed RNA polymerase sigma-70 factor [Planctomycetota bacterium]